MKALDKLVPDEEECDNIRRQLSHYILNNGSFGTNHAIRDQGNLSSRVVEHAWWCYPTAAMFGNTGTFAGGEHFFCREVLEHLQFHPQRQKKQVECRSARELGLCSLQLVIVVPLL